MDQQSSPAEDAVMENNPSSQSREQYVSELEQRLHRLENAIASLQDTRAIEERVVEKVSQRVLPSATGNPVKAEDRIVDSKRNSLKVVTDVFRGKKDPTLAAASLLIQPPGSQPWLIFEMWTEFTTIIRMFFDVRYHVAWFARLAVLLLVPAILTSHWWLPFSAFPILGPIFDKVFDLLLAFIVFKILSRESKRYLLWKEQLRRVQEEKPI